jgi:D-lyxose ketol-isomerase
MKRSEINAILRDADAFIKTLNFHLPPFAYWSPADWQTKARKSARLWSTNWAGTSPILAWVITKRMAVSLHHPQRQRR